VNFLQFSDEEWDGLANNQFAYHPRTLRQVTVVAASIPIEHQLRAGQQLIQ
jgi:hypothetical protein